MYDGRCKTCLFWTEESEGIGRCELAIKKDVVAGLISESKLLTKSWFGCVEHITRKVTR